MRAFLFVAIVALLSGAEGAREPETNTLLTLRPGRVLQANGCQYPPFVQPSEAAALYVVRRNVKDFGAVGDGSHDDSEAFIKALTWDKATKYVPNAPWNASQYNCQTTKPSIVIVPQGTYRVTQLLPLTFYTQLVGESYTDRPTLVFEGEGYHALDAGQDEGPNNGWFGNVNQNNFYHQLRNVIVNIKKCKSCVALHWQVSQATNVVNVHFELGGRDNTGILMENGSGGYLGDVTFFGGGTAMNIGNQQFTFKNVTIASAVKAVHVNWNWVMTFTGLNILDVEIGVHCTNGVGTLSLVDTKIDHAGIAVQLDGGSSQVVLDNVIITNSRTAIEIVNPVYALRNASAAQYWVNGRFYNGTWLQGPTSFTQRPSALLRPDGSGEYFNMMRPDFNASGDAFTFVAPNGTDVTQHLNHALAYAASLNCSVFIPYGVYYLSDTVLLPVGTSLYGEVWTRLLAYGGNFSDPTQPRPMLMVGTESNIDGVARLADLMFSNAGPVPGAIMVRWNARGLAPGDTAAWDVHYRIGGFDGSLMPPSLCPVSAYITESPQCHGAHTLLEVTAMGSLYLENCWGWVADHNIDQGWDNNIFSARGFVSRSREGPVWLLGTAMEHSYLFQYFLDGVRNHYLGVIQTETPYYQPQVLLNTLDEREWDPNYSPNQTHAYSLAARKVSDLALYGTGLYSFFHNWTTALCGGSSYGTLPPCQQVLIRFEDTNFTSNVVLHNVNTHGASTVAMFDGYNVSAVNSLNGFCQTTSFWGTFHY